MPTINAYLKGENMQKTKKGFTIIEVVLVLAIAGLIFLMVFVALPSLQRSQRDTQRRNDLSRFTTALTSYQTNNSGKLPAAGITAKYTADAASLCSKNTFCSAYFGTTEEESTDPDGTEYKVAIIDKSANYVKPTTFDHVIYTVYNAKCGSDGAISSVTGARKYAIVYKLEGSGYYCQDNS